MSKTLNNVEIIDYILDGPNNLVFEDPDCKTHLSEQMTSDDVWAYVGKTLTYSGKRITKFFVNKYGELKQEVNCNGVGKTKIKSYSCDKLSIKKTPHRKQYGTYMYTSLGSIHRLMAAAFLPKPEGATEVDHIDGNPANNCLENLRWVNHSENMLNQRCINRRHYTCTKKWVDAYVQHSTTGIVQYSLDFSQKLAVFKTYEEAARKLGLTKSGVYKLLRQTAKCVGFSQATAASYWLRAETIYWYEQEKVKVK